MEPAPLHKLLLRLLLLRLLLLRLLLLLFRRLPAPAWRPLIVIVHHDNRARTISARRNHGAAWKPRAATARIPGPAATWKPRAVIAGHARSHAGHVAAHSADASPAATAEALRRGLRHEGKRHRAGCEQRDRDAEVPFAVG